MVSADSKTTEWVKLLIGNARALRKAGVLSVDVDGCQAIFSPHTETFDQSAPEDEDEDDDPMDDPSTFGHQSGQAPSYHRGRS